MNFGIIVGNLIVSPSLNAADPSQCNENDLTSNRWGKNIQFIQLFFWIFKNYWASNPLKHKEIFYLFLWDIMWDF